jgi:hypothetical protein
MENKTLWALMYCGEEHARFYTFKQAHKYSRRFFGTFDDNFSYEFGIGLISFVEVDADE